MRSGASVHVWDDWRREKIYNPSMKPALVGHYLKAHGATEPVLIIDPDVIPTGRALPEPVPNTLLGTDTDSYTGAKWLDTKKALQILCQMLDLPPKMALESVGIGAQYISQGIPGDWWLQVAENSVVAYELLKRLPDDAQPWCSEMYITHLMAIRDGYNPTAHPEMQMTWANGPMSGWDDTAFFHDAGVTESNGRDFHKTSYQTSPFKKTIKVHPESASSWYAELIRETAEKFPDIIW